MQTQLDFAYENETRYANRTWLTQPMGKGALETYTWSRGMNEARRMAAHLKSLNLPVGSKIAILAKNNAWWLLSDLAIWMSGHVSVPIYPTLAASSVRQIIEHSEAKLIFIGKLDGFDAMATGIPDLLPRIALPLAPSSLSCPRWVEIISRSEPLKESPHRDADELATLIYTSGSTGEPKGVMHSFRTMCSAFVFIDRAKMTVDDRLISYLPLAHVAERAILETTNFKVGYHVYFAESLDTFIEDVKRAQPTLFGSVPRLWLKFQSGVHAKMPEKKLARLLKIPLLGGIIRKKVLDGLGLRQVRWAVTGSAPTPPEVVAWYRSLGLDLNDVYGMTENFAVSHGTLEGRGRPGYVGAAHPGVTCRVLDSGEVLVKGPGTMLGYYKAEALTAQVLDAEGFIHTGDRGQLDEEQRLKITGRVKELFKTSKGKYVAPAPIENRLLAYSELEQACVAGANMPQPYALVVLAEHLRKASNNREELTQALQRCVESINAELDPHEQLEKIVVMSDEWTVENQLLTPTMKLRRSAIEDRYQPQVDAWYARPESVVWVERGA